MSRSSHPSRRPIGLAKLTPPRLPPVVERRRLFRLLDQARKRPIVWIAGPPGAGKTTLVASYLRAKRVRPPRLPGRGQVWYNVDERDGDLATFFHYLSLAAKQAAPRFRRPLPHLTPEYLLGLPTFTRNFFESLASRLTPRTVLVFDNYHEVPADSPLHELLPVGLRALPRDMAAIIMSRQPPPPAFAGLEAAQLLEVIEPEALRLTQAESDGIMRLRAARERWMLPKTVREKLHGRIQGWVAGLILVLEQVKAGERDAALSCDQPPEVLFKYLASESLRGLPPETHTFLLKTAQLPVMTVAMAEQLTGLASAGEMLARFYRARYFTERRVEAQTWYQYHPLFREFLLARSNTTLPADELKSLQRTAATLLGDAGRTEDAMRLWQEAGGIDEAITLILAQAPTVLAQGRAQALESWLRSVPTPMLEQNPWLLFWLGSCRMFVSPPEAERICEQAHQLFKSQDDPIGTLLAWAQVVHAIVFQWSGYSRLDPWLDEVAHLSPYQLDALPPQFIGPVLNSLILAYRWRRFADPRALEWMDYASAWLPRAQDQFMRAQVGFHLMTGFGWLGEMTRAEDVHRVLETQKNLREASPLTQMMYLMANSMSAWFHGQPDRAFLPLEERRRLAVETGIRVMDHPTNNMKIMMCLMAEDFEEARSIQESQRAALEHRREFMGAMHWFQKANVAMVEGHTEEAWANLSTMLPFVSEIGAPFWEAVFFGAAADVLCAREQQREAWDYLAKAQRAASGIPSKMLMLQLCMTEANVSFREGKESQGLQAVRRGLESGRPQHLLDTTWWIPPVMARLCAKALEAGIETEYAQFLIRKRKLPPPAPAPAAWPWPIRITTLGGFQVLVDDHDQPPRVGRKTPRRLLTLLKALVAGNHAVSRDRLLDTLWPEAEGDAATAALHTTMARLRKLLHSDGAIELREGTVTLDPQACYVDVWTFERLLAEAEAARQAGDHRRWAGLSEQAFHLYHGPFLADDLDQPWSHPQRDRFRCKFAHLVDDLTGHWRQTGHPELAVKCRERAAEVDPEVRAFLRTG